MEPLKNTYNQIFIKDLDIVIKQVITIFNIQLFIDEVFDNKWEQRELKQTITN